MQGPTGPEGTPGSKGLPVCVFVRCTRQPLVLLVFVINASYRAKKEKLVEKGDQVRKGNRYIYILCLSVMSM